MHAWMHQPDRLLRCLLDEIRFAVVFFSRFFRVKLRSMAPLSSGFYCRNDPEPIASHVWPAVLLKHREITGGHFIINQGSHVWLKSRSLKRLLIIFD